MAMTPTQRTLMHCRQEGYLADVTERWVGNPRDWRHRKRKDLFGFIDIVALTPQGILGIQCTSTGNIGARDQKIREECREESSRWLASGGLIEVWGWKKYARRQDGKLWRLTRRQVTL